MSRKKWAILILIILLVFGYIKFFYKTWSQKTVPSSADCVIALDVKRITNTLLWEFITTPGQWKPGKLFSKKEKDTSWLDMLALPDYIFVFHSKNQPANNWYAVFEMKSRAGFEEGLVKFGFEKINSHEFVSRTNRVYFFLQDEKILAGWAPVEDSNLLRKVAGELFDKKEFIARTELQKAIEVKSHHAVYISPNEFLQEPGILSASFNKKKIEINGSFSPFKQFELKENNFQYSNSSVCNIGFSQPPAPLYALLGSTRKENISTALNVNIDSLMQPDNNMYHLDIQGLKEKVDSAVTYSYDNEFNKVEKRVVNNIPEPSFDLSISGKNISAIYDYMQRNNKLENTEEGDLFLPMPLVKAYCSRAGGTKLSVTAYNYTAAAPDKTIRAVFFFHSAVANIPAGIWKYCPDIIPMLLSNISEIELSATLKSQQVSLKGLVIKKENDGPVIKF